MDLNQQECAGIVVGLIIGLIIGYIIGTSATYKKITLEIDDCFDFYKNYEIQKLTECIYGAITPSSYIEPEL